jgi:hypothetical protein
VPRLYGMVFVVGTLVTATLSLDATAIVLTPIVYGTVVRLRLSPLPFMFACLYTANTASLFLPVSNLTNLLAYNAFHPGFSRFAPIMLLPATLAVASNIAIFAVLFRSDLRGTYDTKAHASSPASGAFFWLATAGIFGMLAAFFVSPLLGVPIGLVALAGGAVVVAGARVGGWMRVREVAGSVSWGIVILVVGLFLVVQGVENAGLAAALRDVFVFFGGESLPRILSVASGSAVGSNLINNVPMTIVALRAIDGPLTGEALQPGVVRHPHRNQHRSEPHGRRLPDDPDLAEHRARPRAGDRREGVPEDRRHRHALDPDLRVHRTLGLPAPVRRLKVDWNSARERWPVKSLLCIEAWDWRRVIDGAAPYLEEGEAVIACVIDERPSLGYELAVKGLLGRRRPPEAGMATVSVATAAQIHNRRKGNARGLVSPALREHFADTRITQRSAGKDGERARSGRDIRRARKRQRRQRDHRLGYRFWLDDKPRRRHRRHHPARWDRGTLPAAPRARNSRHRRRRGRGRDQGCAQEEPPPRPSHHGPRLESLGRRPSESPSGPRKASLGHTARFIIDHVACDVVVLQL